MATTAEESFQDAMLTAHTCREKLRLLAEGATNPQSVAALAQAFQQVQQAEQLAIETYSRRLQEDA